MRTGLVRKQDGCVFVEHDSNSDRRRVVDARLTRQLLHSSPCHSSDLNRLHSTLIRLQPPLNIFRVGSAVRC